MLLNLKTVQTKKTKSILPMNLMQGESHYHKNNLINALQADYKDNIYTKVLGHL